MFGAVSVQVREAVRVSGAVCARGCTRQEVQDVEPLQRDRHGHGLLARAADGVDAAGYDIHAAVPNVGSVERLLTASGALNRAAQKLKPHPGQSMFASSIWMMLTRVGITFAWVTA